MAVEEETVENFRCGKQPECISAPSCDRIPELGDGASSIPGWSGGTRSRITGAASGVDINRSASVHPAAIYSRYWAMASPPSHVGRVGREVGSRLPRKQ